MRFPKLMLVAFLAMFLTIGAFLVPSANKAQAHVVPASTHKIQISDLTMIDQQHGWAFNEDHTHVFSTSQGPEHWVDVTPAFFSSNPSSFITITTSFFLNATHGYIGLLQDNNTFLLSTQNSGRTWQTTPFNAPPITDAASIKQITFLDAWHGWLSFNLGQREPGRFSILLMSTTDGGQTWQTLFDASQDPTILPAPAGLSNNFTFVSPQDGWATGIWLSGYVYLYATHDGGKTWSDANIPLIKGANDVESTQGYGPFWQDSHSGTLFVRYAIDTGNGLPHVTAYQTHDGGKSWILGPSSPSTSFQELNTFSFLNAQEGWSFGFDDQGKYVIHHTSTGSLTWNIFQPAGLPPAQADTRVLVSLTFINTTTGWLIIKDEQGNYNLFQTGTGGHTWHTVQPVTS